MAHATVHLAAPVHVRWRGQERSVVSVALPALLVGLLLYRGLDVGGDLDSPNRFPRVLGGTEEHATGQVCRRHRLGAGTAALDVVAAGVLAAAVRTARSLTARYWRAGSSTRKVPSRVPSTVSTSVPRIDDVHDEPSPAASRSCGIGVARSRSRQVVLAWHAGPGQIPIRGKGSRPSTGPISSTAPRNAMRGAVALEDSALRPPEHIVIREGRFPVTDVATPDGPPRTAVQLLAGVCPSPGGSRSWSTNARTRATSTSARAVRPE